MSYSDLQISGIKGCQRLVSRARKTMLRLTSLSDALRELSNAIQVEAEAAQENYKVVSNMSNLIFLPNELLGRIFQFVVNGDPSQTTSIRMKAAVSLSHVSQYFRVTALSCASLWSNISGSSDINLLCLSRSKDAQLDVVTEIALTSVGDRDELVFEQSLTDALPHSERWKTLDIQYVYKQPRHDDQIPGRNLRIRQSFRKIDVRSLVSLHIRNIKNPKRTLYGDPERTVKDYHEFQHWDAPNLRHLTSVYYFPLSLPGLVNVTSLDVTLKPGQINMINFHQDLSRMKNLESLALKLDGVIVSASYEYVDQLESFGNVGEVEFQRVRRLEIEMNSQGSGWINIFKAFFSSMSFPSAVDLHIKVGGRLTVAYSEIDLDEAFLTLSSEVESIIQHEEQFPRVERFYLEANGLNISDADDGHSVKDHRSFIRLSAPLGLLPNLKHFTLCSNGCPSPIYLTSSTSENQNLPLFPALETITVQIIKNASLEVAFFVRKVLLKQKEQGGWGEFRELIVKDNSFDKKLKGNNVMKAYSRDDALEWCQRRSRIYVRFDIAPLCYVHSYTTRYRMTLF